MLDKDFQLLYETFRMKFYKKIFKEENKDDALSANEMFCAESIYLMNKPTFGEFADFIGVSKSNLNYKINRLIEKGFVKKNCSKKDKREYHLSVSEKFLDFYMLNDSITKEFVEKVREELDENELKVLESFISRINKVMND